MSADRTFRVLHLASSERWTGVAEPVISLAAHQQKAGHRVWLGCVPGQSFERVARARGVPILDGIHLNRRLYPHHFVGDFARIRRFVRKEQIEIVHTHLLNDNWLAALSLMGLRRTFLLARTFHRWERPRRDPFHSWLFGRRNDVTIATSQSLLSLFNGRIRLKPGSSRVVYGGVDTEAFNPTTSGEPIRKEFELSPETPVAGYISRLNYGRGHDWLLEAVPEITRRLPGARVVISGRGPLKKPLRKRVAESSLREHVIMTGYRAKDLREAYASFDVALFLGMGSEGTCRAALEAMATGKPVIAPRATALPEIVDDGKTGLLVDPGNAKALADAIVHLLTHRDEREAMGRAARQAVLERFTERQRAEATLEAYRAGWDAMARQG